MEESQIRKKITNQLENEGWTWWRAANTQWQSNDIFTLFDLICARKNILRFIQLTTKPNISKHLKKIKSYFKEHDIEIGCEIWGYDESKDNFDIRYL